MATSRRPDPFARPPLTVGQLAEARAGQGALVVVRGEIARLLGDPIVPPARLPAAVGQLADLAVIVLDVELPRFLDRPLCERHTLARPFVLRDGATGALALVEIPPPGEGGGLEARLGAPFVEGTDGARSVLVRAARLGGELILTGRLRLGAPTPGALAGLVATAYRDAPALPILEAEAVWDGVAWEAAAAWRALPWYRKLSLLVRNR